MCEMLFSQGTAVGEPEGSRATANALRPARPRIPRVVVGIVATATAVAAAVLPPAALVAVRAAPAALNGVGVEAVDGAVVAALARRIVFPFPGPQPESSNVGVPRCMQCKAVKPSGSTGEEGADLRAEVVVGVHAHNVFFCKGWYVGRTYQ